MNRLADNPELQRLKRLIDSQQVRVYVEPPKELLDEFRKSMQGATPDMIIMNDIIEIEDVSNAK